MVDSHLCATEWRNKRKYSPVPFFARRDTAQSNVLDTAIGMSNARHHTRLNVRLVPIAKGVGLTRLNSLVIKKPFGIAILVVGNPCMKANGAVIARLDRMKVRLI